jgi:hypothetical protein
MMNGPTQRLVRSPHPTHATHGAHEARAAPTGAGAGAGAHDAPEAQQVERFEQALRERRAAVVPGDAGDAMEEPDDADDVEEAPAPSPDEVAPRPIAAAFAALLLPPLPPGPAPAPHGSPAVQAPPETARVQLAPAPLVGDAPQAFEVVLQEPMGAPVSLRITQLETAAQGMVVPAWRVRVNSTSLNLAELRRNSGRLGARLRSRSLSDDVGIDTDDPPR